MSIERTTVHGTSQALAAELVHVSNTSTELARACYAAMREARDAYAHAEGYLAMTVAAERKLVEARELNAGLSSELDSVRAELKELELRLAMANEREERLVAELKGRATR